MDITSHFGILRRQSRHSVDETVGKLEDLLRRRGGRLFAVIDHSGEARKVGLQMPKTKLVIFGNPQDGTPIMLAAPSAALDLPLKMLVAEDGDGKTWLSYNSPSYLEVRHGIAAELTKAIASIEDLANAVAD